MGHLIEEHSSECLLCLIEMVQYKECLLNDMKSVQIPNQIQNASHSSFPSTTPMTAIEFQKQETIKQKERHLSLPNESPQQQQQHLPVTKTKFIKQNCTY